MERHSDIVIFVVYVKDHWCSRFRYYAWHNTEIGAIEIAENSGMKEYKIEMEKV